MSVFKSNKVAAKLIKLKFDSFSRLTLKNKTKKKKLYYFVHLLVSKNVTTLGENMTPAHVFPDVFDVFDRGRGHRSLSLTERGGAQIPHVHLFVVMEEQRWRYWPIA